MAKDQNTFAKRAREMEKRRKAEAKRTRRQKKKEQAAELGANPNGAADAETVDSDSASPDNVAGGNADP
ncbi:MAG: hypothetical protein JW818_02010 [Pirellulales bacterium]|nr:hypothetical protein [Pirellulales bacterium]